MVFKIDKKIKDLVGNINIFWKFVFLIYFCLLITFISIPDGLGLHSLWILVESGFFDSESSKPEIRKIL